MIPPAVALPYPTTASDFEQLVRVVFHPFDSEQHFMGLINAAYCDESETLQSHPVYVVSGYLANGVDWFEFERKWCCALRDEGLEAVGFHMAWCEHGSRAPYDAMPIDRRAELQRKFIDIIGGSNLWAYATAIDLTAYRAVTEQIKKKRPALWKPYYLAFQHTVEMMCKVLDDGGFAKSECISFMFDEHQEYGKRAKALYQRMRTPENAFAHRLGSITFGDDTRYLPLQAADLWAYESRGFFRDHHVRAVPPRWQFLRLRENRTPNNLQIKYFGPAEIAKWAARYGVK